MLSDEFGNCLGDSRPTIMPISDEEYSDRLLPVSEYPFSEITVLRDQDTVELS